MRRFVATLLFTLALGVTAEAKDKWLEARSAHFTVVSNGGEGRAKQILKDLEQLRRLINELLPAQRVDGSKPAIFYLFKNAKSMRPFQPTVSDKREEWYGMYRPTPFRNIVLMRSDGTSDAARKLAFGQYMHLLESYNKADYPVWLSNGLSRFYANTEITKDQARVGKMRPEYRRELSNFRSMPIRELFAVDHSSDHYRDLSKRPLFDAQSWALVHYLLIGQARENGAQRLGRYLHMLRQGREPLRAFEEAMGKSLDDINSDVAFYMKKSITLHLQVKLRPFEMDKDFGITKLDDNEVKGHEGQLLMAVGYLDEAEKSLAVSIEANPGQVTAYEAMASLRDRQGKTDEVAALLERAIRNGSTNPHVQLRRVQLFVQAHESTIADLADETTASVMDSLRFVVNEAPDLTDAARLFGFLALFHEESREEGLQIVTDALERDQGNSSLMFMSGQLRAKGGDYAGALGLYKKLLDRQLNSEFKAAVRRQYDFVDAKLEIEAQRSADVSGGAEGGVGAKADDSSAAASADANTKTVEIRGTLVRFDCSQGHRFIVESEGLTYVLAMVADRVSILENGEPVASREFYCGPLDEHVIVRYIPEPVEKGSVERTGRLVSIHFIIP